MPQVNETFGTLTWSANAFAANAPVATLFPGAHRRVALEKLQHLSRYSDDIVALIGPDGIGKSTVGDFFAREAAKDQIVARARASMLTSPTQLLEEMFKAFVLDFPAHGSISDLKYALQNYFSAAHKQGRSVVLVVDDAHELGDDAFSLLVRLALTENAEGAFHLLLLGEPQLHDMLDYTCPLKNGASQFTCLQLSPLTMDETRNYLRYRLNSVGLNRDEEAHPFPLSKNQVERIHKLADGIPGRINTQAQLLLGSPQGIMARFLPLFGTSFPRGFPRNYAIAAVALLAVLLIAFISGGGDENVADTRTTVSVPIPLPSVADATLVDSASVRRDGDLPDSGANVQDANAAGSDVTSSLVPTVSSAVTSPPSSSGSASTPSTTASAPSTSTAVAASTPVPVTSAPAVRPSAPSSSSTVAATPAGNASAPADAQEGQRNRILALPPTQFTMQLMGAASRANVEDYVRRQANSAIYWYETRNNGRPWFVIIHGTYASQGEAQSAITGLSGDLSKLEPWIRPLSAVQAEIRAQN